MLREKKLPSLFDICNDQVIIVANMATRRWRVNFRRWPALGLQDEYKSL
jgi:hypothetical protein